MEMSSTAEPARKRRKPNEAEKNMSFMINHHAAVAATVTPIKTPKASNSTASEADIDEDTITHLTFENEDATRHNERNKANDEGKQEEIDKLVVVTQLIENLRFAMSFEAAEKAIDMLFQELHTEDANVSTYDPRKTTTAFHNPDHISLPVAKVITRSNGVLTIFVALQEFQHSGSNMFLCKTLRLLSLISSEVPAAGQQLIESGAVRSLLMLARKGAHVDCLKLHKYDQIKRNFDYSLKSNVVGILADLVFGLGWNICKQVVPEETLDFVISVIKEYPEDEFMQHVGIEYLLCVGKTGDSETSTMLQKKKVGHLFLEALDNFRHESVEVKEMAREAMVWYFSI
ncbi:unnamed protein product [Cylindrotheca closterium]|uniref:Uncharacterized protein n=1 Tax=Cylindrotheca closterium TaxID=2856 RepID=A0AAD2JN46_9STRA|nr:unnamed protein product [Cylindrotheca closterium]